VFFSKTILLINLIYGLFGLRIIEFFLKDFVSLFKEPKIELLKIFLFESFTLGHVERRFGGEDFKGFVHRSLLKRFCCSGIVS
jgi:hypothetical protein